MIFYHISKFDSVRSQKIFQYMHIINLSTLTSPSHRMVKCENDYVHTVLNMLCLQKLCCPLVLIITHALGEVHHDFFCAFTCSCLHHWVSKVSVTSKCSCIFSYVLSIHTYNSWLMITCPLAPFIQQSFSSHKKHV